MGEWVFKWLKWQSNTQAFLIHFILWIMNWNTDRHSHAILLLFYMRVSVSARYCCCCCCYFYYWLWVKGGMDFVFNRSFALCMLCAACNIKKRNKTYAIQSIHSYVWCGKSRHEWENSNIQWDQDIQAHTHHISIAGVWVFFSSYLCRIDSIELSRLYKKKKKKPSSSFIRYESYYEKDMCSTQTGDEDKYDEHTYDDGKKRGFCLAFYFFYTLYNAHVSVCMCIYFERIAIRIATWIHREFNLCLFILFALSLSIFVFLFHIYRMYKHQVLYRFLCLNASDQWSDFEIVQN